jgi:hypothetical protein
MKFTIEFTVSNGFFTVINQISAFMPEGVHCHPTIFLTYSLVQQINLHQEVLGFTAFLDENYFFVTRGYVLMCCDSFFP